jgi:hypothetical protein
LYKINKKKDRKQIFLKRCLILGIFVADFSMAYLFYADYYGVFPSSSLFLTNTTPLSKKTAEYLVYIINLFTFAHIKM